MKTLLKQMLLTALAFVVAASASPQSGAPGSTGATSERIIPLPDFTPLMKSEGPPVVNVITAKKPAAQARGGGAPHPDDPMYEFFRRFIPEFPGVPGAPDARRQRGGIGSGFIISPDGHILTNAHVVADFDDVMVRFADAKREFKAKVLGIDRRTDVALLKVEAKDVPRVKLGNSSRVEPGQWVAAIGSPFGFANTITAGEPGKLRRAAHQPEGGGDRNQLDDLQRHRRLHGRLLRHPDRGRARCCQATPGDRQGDARAPGHRHPAGHEGARRVLQLDEPVGVVVTHVEKGGPILSYNGKRIEDPNELPRLVAATEPGDKATLEVWRDGRREQLAATVGEFPDEPLAAAREAPAKQARSNLGLDVSELSPEKRKALGVDYGLLVEGLREGPAAASGIRPGDVIVAVGQDELPLLVRRGEGARFVPVELA